MKTAIPTPTGEGERHFSGAGLPRQTRDAPGAGERRSRPHHEWPARPLVVRDPGEIRGDVQEQLRDSPFIDATGISVSVDGSEVTLDGTINSLIAISLAQALAADIAGVGRVQVHLRVQPAAAVHETAAGPVRRIDE